MLAVVRVPSFESPSTSRTRREVRMSARPLAQRKRTRFQRVARNDSEERFDLITVGDNRKNERARPSPS